MSNFPLVWAFGAPFKGIFTSADATTIDGRFPRISNWKEGSDHTLDASAVVALRGTAGASNNLLLDLPVEIPQDQTLALTGASGHPAKLNVGNFCTIDVLSGGTVKVESGGTLRTLSGSTITVDSGSVSSVNADWNIESGAKIRTKSGGTQQVDAGASATNASVLGVQFTGTDPAVTADPGANNIAIGLNQCKAWGSLLSDGAGGYTCPRGMNVASVAVSASGAGWQVLFHASRPMDSNDYAITATHRLLAGTPAGPWFAQVELQSSLGFTINIYKHDGTPAVLSTNTFACGFQIEAKQ